MKNVNDGLFEGMIGDSLTTVALEQIHGGANSQSTGDCQSTNYGGPDCTDTTTGRTSDTIESGAEFDR